MTIKLEDFTGAERVLFNATVDFAITYEKLSIEQAWAKGYDKIRRTRELVRKTKFRY